MTDFSKLEKYDKSYKNTIVEKVEKLIKLQNKYQYHMLQRYKNECRNELKKIEKFTK
jgi:geranylgeranyl pyrophosphate synthase